MGADAWQSHLPGTHEKEQLLECNAIIKRTIMSFPGPWMMVVRAANDTVCLGAAHRVQRVEEAPICGSLICLAHRQRSGC